MNNIKITKEELKNLLEQTYSDGFNFGGQNERASLHEFEGYNERKDSDIDKLLSVKLNC